MSWSYDPDQLQTDPKDQVRFLVGDVVESQPLVQDEEIMFALDQAKNVYDAAALICESIAGMFSRQVDRQTGDVRTSFSQRAKAYAERAKEFREKAGSMALARAKPLAGGISVSDKRRAGRNTDRVKPAFSRGRFGGRC